LKTIFYNDIDPHVCAWTTELIKLGAIPDGDVVCKSLLDITPDEIKHYTQIHLCNGIAGWAYALSLAGWPADRPIVSISCPCQPFSVAGKGLGTADDRHLWPHFAKLIRECDVQCAIGEQVASAAGREWLAGVQADLEGMGFAFGAADLCAASAGAPHIRQRLYWVAESRQQQARGCLHGPAESVGQGGSRASNELGRSGDVDRMADASRSGRGQGSSSEPGQAGRGTLIDERGAENTATTGTDPAAESAGRVDRLADPARRGQRTDGSAPGSAGHADERDQADRVADSEQPRLEGQSRDGNHGDQPGRLDQEQAGPVAAGGQLDGMEHSASGRREMEIQQPASGSAENGCWETDKLGGERADGGMEHPNRPGSQPGKPATAPAGYRGAIKPAGSRANFWSDYAIIPCLDGKSRRTKPSIRPLVAVLPKGMVRGSDPSLPIDTEATSEARVMRLRGYGNAIVPELAAEFIRAYMDVSDLSK